MEESESTFDSVAYAFERMRQEAKRRNDGHAPKINRPRRIRTSKSLKPKSLGKPTGKDGRYIPYGDRSLEGVNSLVEREINDRGWRTGLAGGWVNSHWSELVGERIAGHTTVESLKDKKLFISCDSTAWASNLRTMQIEILEKIAKKVGPNIVVELHISGPKTPSWRYGPLHVKGRGPRDTYG